MKHWKLYGALAVIGPTRMPYDRIIPVVDITAKLLSAALTHYSDNSLKK